jgi:hypothetical protein
MRRWISEYRWFFIAFLAFGVILIKQVYRIGGTFDIWPADEARYIETALSGNWPLDGVFYYAYLRVLSWFIADPLDLYQANFSVLIILTGVSVFILSSVMLSLCAACLLSIVGFRCLSDDRHHLAFHHAFCCFVPCAACCSLLLAISKQAQDPAGCTCRLHSTHVHPP